MKKIITIAAVVLVVVFVAAFTKDAVIKMSVEKGVELVMGLKLNIGGLSVGILRPIVHIKNLKLLNPPGFHDRTMIDMPEIYVNYDLPAIMGGKIHLPEVRLALREFVVVKNANGKLNLDSLRMVRAQKEGKAPSEETPGKAPEIQIDSLNLSIGKVVYRDYSKGGAPIVKEFNVNINESYTNVDDPYSLASLIVVKALMNTSIASLTNFDLRGMQGTIGDTLASAHKMAANVMENVAASQETAKQAAKAATEAAAKAQDVAKQTADTVKNVFKNPFGE
ncbi:MAG: hypothetical protein WC592_04050 [Candidatus Omnitrophota bacterium]|nr:hypothetical protein [Candidatus Omnitrophota bacterium]